MLEYTGSALCVVLVVSFLLFSGSDQLSSLDWVTSYAKDSLNFPYSEKNMYNCTCFWITDSLSVCDLHLNRGEAAQHHGALSWQATILRPAWREENCVRPGHTESRVRSWPRCPSRVYPVRIRRTPCWKKRERESDGWLPARLSSASEAEITVKSLSHTSDYLRQGRTRASVRPGAPHFRLTLPSCAWRTCCSARPLRWSAECWLDAKTLGAQATRWHWSCLVWFWLVNSDALIANYGIK